MFKQQKGITLIALVITIIVLLILAGITIAMLTGSDSAPAKANEAKQKQDIGSVKDQVYLTSSNAQLDYYNETYVVNGVATSGSVSNTDSKRGVGAAVALELSNDYSTTKTIGDAKIKVVDNVQRNTDKTPKKYDATNIPDNAASIKIVTRDYYVLGYVEAVGGAIKWTAILNTGDTVPTGFTDVTM